MRACVNSQSIKHTNQPINHPFALARCARSRVLVGRKGATRAPLMYSFPHLPLPLSPLTPLPLSVARSARECPSLAALANASRSLRSRVPVARCARECPSLAALASAATGRAALIVRASNCSPTRCPSMVATGGALSIIRAKNCPPTRCSSRPSFL